jgi:hypothetical protein
LQKLSVEGKGFDYPNAIENAASSWSKTVPAQMRRISKHSSWVKGFLEISNNDNLMFQDVSYFKKYSDSKKSNMLIVN